MDYLVFFANDVEKISILGKKKAQVLTASTTRTEKSAVRIVRIPARKAHSEIFKINTRKDLTDTCTHFRKNSGFKNPFGQKF